MMSEATGRLLPLTDHVRQSIRNILFTAVGTRVQREEYGSCWTCRSTTSRCCAAMPP